ncbi:hypothetical protein J7E96_19245 [Streptomyces sp. ISL-96]|uniref:hypothetical protein n=1 Tax=Streptomyces sp. ISL-96 TaxID=2819191 RepID=UPI001BE6F63C|nr:hypothetical protein [Streptomyces sp. ISL-96]MBT2490610.1 hypothetical protein [Streptomyces sp. ISL-96]
MAVRFAAVGVAAVLVLPVSGAVSGAYADERAPGPTPASTSASVSTSTSMSMSTTPPDGGEDRELVPGVGAPDWPERPSASAASPAKSLAGRPAGEGRTRPGRPSDKSAPPSRSEEEGGKASPSGSGSPSGSPGVAPSRSASGSASASASSAATPLKSYAPEPWDVHEEALEEPGNDPDGSPSIAAPPGAAHEGSEQVVAQSDPLGIHVLPLGAGLTLVGLGLGFLGLRLRRG